MHTTRCRCHDRQDIFPITAIGGHTVMPCQTDWFDSNFPPLPHTDTLSLSPYPSGPLSEPPTPKASMAMATNYSISNAPFTVKPSAPHKQVHHPKQAIYFIRFFPFKFELSVHAFSLFCEGSKLEISYN